MISFKMQNNRNRRDRDILCNERKTSHEIHEILMEVRASGDDACSHESLPAGCGDSCTCTHVGSGWRRF